MTYLSIEEKKRKNIKNKYITIKNKKQYSFSKFFDDIAGFQSEAVTEHSLDLHEDLSTGFCSVFLSLM
jgi:hypothetical protein